VNTERKPLFSLGKIVATPGSLEAFERNHVDYLSLLGWHVVGDWGDLDQEDKDENDLSVREGYRILSVYTLPDGTKMWVITEADRSLTTFLLPDEY